MREWKDETTGRMVRQLTDLPDGGHVSYFRLPRQVPGGWMIAWGRHAAGNILLIRPETGEVRQLPLSVAEGEYLKLNERTGTLWYTPVAAASSPAGKPDGGAHPPAPPIHARTIWAVNLPDGSPRLVATVPRNIPGTPVDITCDGQTVILQEFVQDLKAFPIPTTKDVKAFWHYINRPRTGRLWAYNLASGAKTCLAESDCLCFCHPDASPSDPTLLRYAQDMFDGLGQRAWTVRTDGSARTAIRPQAKFEVVTHEFWWPDSQHIGYTYQDRRGDTTFYDLPWCEYSPIPTQLGIAGLDGRERYLSDPLNHYHTHIFASPNGSWVCGEGTDGHSFIYAAPFAWGRTRIEFIPLATVHTPYIPFRGQFVDAAFSHDSRWILYNDTIQGRLQVCAVRVDI